jgi:hypothetical protein
VFISQTVRHALNQLDLVVESLGHAVAVPLPDVMDKSAQTNVSRSRPDASAALGYSGSVRDHRVNPFKINALIFDILLYEFVSH